MNYFTAILFILISITTNSQMSNGINCPCLIYEYNYSNEFNVIEIKGVNAVGYKLDPSFNYIMSHVGSTQFGNGNVIIGNGFTSFDINDNWYVDYSILDYYTSYRVKMLEKNRGCMSRSEIYDSIRMIMSDYLNDSIK